LSANILVCLKIDPSKLSKFIRHASPHIPCQRRSCQLVTDLLATRQTIWTCQDSLPQQVDNKSL